MDFDEYQAKSRTTASPYIDACDKQEVPAFFYSGLGLAGEGGEIANNLKKIIRDDGGVVTGDRRLALTKELGDVLWYVANLATDIGVSLSFVASENLVRLADRAARGVIRGSGDNR